MYPVCWHFKLLYLCFLPFPMEADSNSSTKRWYHRCWIDNERASNGFSGRTHLQTPWSTLLEKLTVAQLVNNFPPLMEPKGSLPCPHESPNGPAPNESIPHSQLNLIKIHFNIISLGLPKQPPSFTFSRFLFHACYMPRCSHLPSLDRLIRWPFEKLVDWRQCAAVMHREAVTVMPSCSGRG
jgi:hypothetical protein